MLNKAENEYDRAFVIHVQKQPLQKQLFYHALHYRSLVSVAGGNRHRPAAISGGNRNANTVSFYSSNVTTRDMLGRRPGQRQSQCARCEASLTCQEALPMCPFPGDTGGWNLEVGSTRRPSRTHRPPGNCSRSGRSSQREVDVLEDCSLSTHRK